jgi:hypothetical protein
MSLNKLCDFIQVVYIMRKYYTEVEYFPYHILFITIYLLLDYKLVHNTNAMQETNMSNFVQANEHQVYMYAKFGYLCTYRF